MAIQQSSIQQSTNSSTLADILERILDKGIVIAGDIKIKLVDIELLTIQIRLLIASVDKAKEMGMDWWVNNPAFNKNAETAGLRQAQAAVSLPNGGELSEVAELKTRLAQLESRLG